MNKTQSFLKRPDFAIAIAAGFLIASGFSKGPPSLVLAGMALAVTSILAVGRTNFYIRTIQSLEVRVQELENANNSNT